MPSVAALLSDLPEQEAGPTCQRSVERPQLPGVILPSAANPWESEVWKCNSLPKPRQIHGSDQYVWV